MAQQQPAAARNRSTDPELERVSGPQMVMLLVSDVRFIVLIGALLFQQRLTLTSPIPVHYGG
jgi:hypothetical protein